MAVTAQGLARSWRGVALALVCACLLVQAPTSVARATHGGPNGECIGCGLYILGGIVLGGPIVLVQIVALVKNIGALVRGQRSGNGWAIAAGILGALAMTAGAVMLGENVPTAAGVGALVWGGLGLGLAIGAALQPLNEPALRPSVSAQAFLPLHPTRGVAAFRLEVPRLLAGWFESPAVLVPELGAGPTRARAIERSAQQTNVLARPE